MLVIGLAGGSGSGKGRVAGFFSGYGVLHIDTDAIYHDMTAGDSPCLRELCAAFGDVRGEDGGLDRKRLGAIVFADGERLKELNRITHKHILAKVRDMISVAREEGRFAALVDAPVLFESGFDAECDLVISVLAGREERVRRIMSRDGITREAAEARISRQLSDEEIKKRSDYLIYNDGDVDALGAAVEEIILKLKNERK